MSRDHYKGVPRYPEDVKVTNSSTGDGPHRDGFTKLRTSVPHTLFDSTHEVGKNPLVWDEQLLGSSTSTHAQNIAAILMSVGVTAGDSVVRQTKQYFKYQPGKSHNILMTGTFDTLKEGLRQRLGYFDVENGIFFQTDGLDLGIVLRSSSTGSPIDEVVLQKQWNLDRLDGRGPSRKVLDPTKSQIFFIDLEWLGVGRVRTGFVLGGSIVYCHEFLHANLGLGAYMATATLPCRCEITNVSNTVSPSTFTQICATVISEGGHNPQGFVRGVDSGITVKNIALNENAPVLSIRLKPEFNTASLVPIAYQLFSRTKDDVRVSLVLNPTLTNASFVDVGPNSIAQCDRSATTVSGGETIWAGYTSEAATGTLTNFASNESYLVLAATISGGLDVLTLVAQPLGPGAADVLGVFNFKEIY